MRALLSPALLSDSCYAFQASLFCPQHLQFPIMMVILALELLPKSLSLTKIFFFTHTCGAEQFETKHFLPGAPACDLPR